MRMKCCFEKFFLLLGWSLLSIGGYAQVVQEDANWNYRPGQKATYAPVRGNILDTLTISAQSPFFDDFSQGLREPDSSLWYTPSFFFDVPQITQNMAINPPTQGVVTFDGLTREGTPYATNGLFTGETDRLSSQCIDLRSYDANDALYLSFALQAQGRGDAPEAATDSFLVFLRTNDPDPDNFIKELAIPGGSVQPFEQYTIQLTNAGYFQECFQIVFQTLGTQSAALDHWHLDYVKLAPGRTPSDTVFLDVAPIQLTSSPFAPYTAIPYSYYIDQPWMKPFSVSVGNLDDDGMDVEVNAELSDPVLQSSFSGFFAQQAIVSVDAKQDVDVPLAAFDEQGLPGDAAFELAFTTVANRDNIPQNNTMTHRFPIDSIWAYDDGEADGGFGMNRARGFGVEVNLPRPDSISAVWIHFVPVVYVNPINGDVDYLQDQDFRLTIWGDADPDSILASRSLKVNYGDEPNHFERYAFLQPVKVPTKFWVGVRQTNNLPINLGLDRTYDNRSLMYYDSLGNWTPISLAGSFMIRPEVFSGGRNTVADIDPWATIAGPAPQLYPNPAYDGNIYLEGEHQVYINYQGELWDMEGRLVWRLDKWETQALQIPADLPDGFYIWRQKYQKKGQKAMVSHQKWMLQRGN
ncbi:MAG: T9SS type A sorting domain-containing protein [Bacteroidota bacterium]